MSDSEDSVQSIYREKNRCSNPYQDAGAPVVLMYRTAGCAGCRERDVVGS